MNYDKSKIMKEAWRMIRANGMTKSEALRAAWLNAKAKRLMMQGVATFYYLKMDGTVREARGTLAAGLVPAVGGARRDNDTLQVYYDLDRGAWRCYKKANIFEVAA